MRWKIRREPLTIRQRLILSFMTVSLISVCLMAWFSSYFYNESVKKDYVNISSEATERINQYIELYIEQLVKSTNNLIQADEIQDWVIERRTYTHDDIQHLADELRRQFVLNYQEVVGVFLISKQSRILSLDGLNYMDHSLYKQEPWYQTQVTKATVLPTHKVSYHRGIGTSVLSLVVPIYNKDTIERSGHLVIDFSLERFDQILATSGLGQSGLFFIVSKDDTIVYHPRKEWIGQPRSSTPLADLSLIQEKQALVQSWQGERNLISYSISKSNEWKIASLVPYDEMAHGLKAASRSIILVLAVITLTLICVVPILSNSFTKPIRSLKRTMHEVAAGNLSAQAKTSSTILEFRELNASFNKMVNQLNELIETVSDLKLQEVHLRLRQKEALIKALQNQINPHLLYNALDIIKSIAYLEEVPKIEQMARNLADVYRYTARITDIVVPLSQELEVVSKTLEIIHIRFPKQFKSSILVNDKYMDCGIVKLSIQPIVENAVKYAIEPSSGRCTILISAYSDQADLVIEIADNGIGFDPTRLSELEKELVYISEHAHDKYVQHNSLGISNVHARLVLQYGEGYGISVRSFSQRGTVVSIRIPLSVQQQTEKEKIG